MTPLHYTRKKLKSLLKGKGYFLYHWTSLEAAISIIREGHIYSKATLFGLRYPNFQEISFIKQRNARSEARAGFIDYIFLGNCNWASEGMRCWYGNVCFVIKPEEILPSKEFFVFPFNSGNDFFKMSDMQKVSDLSTLMAALEKRNLNSEVLIRRKLKISERYIQQIICNPDDQGILQKQLNENELFNIPIVRHQIIANQDNDEAFDGVVLTGALEGVEGEIEVDENSYIRRENILYVKLESSNCVFRLRVDENGRLFDLSDKEVGSLGRLSNTHLIVP